MGKWRSRREDKSRLEPSCRGTSYSSELFLALSTELRCNSFRGHGKLGGERRRRRGQVAVEPSFEYGDEEEGGNNVTSFSGPNPFIMNERGEE